MGNIGELAVEEHFDSQRTDDWYDSRKDGMINNMSYEVKTFRLNGKTKGFWIDKSQWKKVDGVDILIFVRVPETTDERARIYVCINHKNCWQKAYRNDGTGVRSYPLTNCIYIGTIGEERSLQLYEHSVKISKHKRLINAA